jgi:hypothetical protein
MAIVFELTRLLMQHDFNIRHHSLQRLALVLWLALSGGSQECLLAQGTILFATRNGVPFVLGPVLDGRTGECFEAGDAWAAQLYYSTDLSAGAPLRPLSPATTFYTRSETNPFRSCYVQPVLVILPGVAPRETVQLQMRVWNTTAGATYEEAAANPIGVVGQSSRFDAMTGDASITGTLVNLQGFSVYPVPEPSTLLLLGLCAAALALFSRRKATGPTSSSEPG